MKYIEKHPMIMIVVGILGISASAIFVRFSAAPSAVTAAWRLLWTALLMTPVVLTKKQVRQEMRGLDKRTLLLSCVSAVVVGLLLAVFSTILGHSIFSWCLKYFSPAFVSASKLCEPVVAAILAAFLFGELPAPLQLLGGGLILGGVYGYSWIEGKGEN